jgi:hypothetical protein
MARDPVTPADPGSTQNTEVDPSQSTPNRWGSGGDDSSEYDGGDYQFWLHEGTTPFRTLGPAQADVFSRDDNGWMRQSAIDRAKLWDSSPGEIAGRIGGRHRLTEPVKGTAPLDPGPDEDFAPVESPDYIAEADSEADLPQPPPSEQDEEASDLPPGGMNEQQIRDAGLRVDVPFESPLPVGLKYKNTGQQEWTPPPGFRQGLPPIDEDLATSLGVPRDLGNQEGAEGGSTSGDTGEPGS